MQSATLIVTDSTPSQGTLPNFASPCECGTRQLHFGMTVLAPEQMSRFSSKPKKQQAAGNYVEGLLMYIYERGSESREHRMLFFGLAYCRGAYSDAGEAVHRVLLEEWVGSPHHDCSPREAPYMRSPAL